MLISRILFIIMIYKLHIIVPDWTPKNLIENVDIWLPSNNYTLRADMIHL